MASHNILVILALSFLLVLPGYALSRLTQQFDWRFAVGIPGAVSVVTFLVYRSDKRRAETRDWRIPEITLHLLALLGGWPGAFLAQRVYRHKTSKLSFQLIFWVIVLLHQLAALDSLMDWRLTKTTLHALT